jgi:hypothetical protein
MTAWYGELHEFQSCAKYDRWGGRIVMFEGGFADHNLHDLTFFIEKHNTYATREAIDRR